MIDIVITIVISAFIYLAFTLIIGIRGLVLRKYELYESKYQDYLQQKQRVLKSLSEGRQRDEE